MVAEMDVAERLFLDIIRAIQRASVTEPVYSLVLAYDSEKPVPPILGIGTVRELQHWLDAGASTARDYVWNPAEYEIFDSVELELSEEEYDLYWAALQAEFGSVGAYEAARQCLLEVARRLSQHNYNGLLTTSSLFVAYPVHLEMHDLEDNFREVVPDETLVDIKSQGLL